MEILALINSSLPLSNSTQPMSESNSSLPLILAFSHFNATRITTPSSLDRNRQAFFLIGMSFLGGLLAGVLLNCFYTFLVNYFLRHLDWEDSFVVPAEGHVNLSYIGDTEFIDPPPDYSAVVGERLGVVGEGGRAGPFFGFFKRFSRRRTERESVAVEDEAPPPSYSSYLVSLETDLNSR